MSKEKRFLLRLDPEVYGAIERWAADDLRSVNAEIEFLLREALRRAGRLPAAKRQKPVEPEDAAEDSPRGP